MMKNVFYTGLMATAISMSTVAQAQVSPAHVADIKNITSSTISADGSYVAYTMSIPADPKKENLPNKSHLYVMNTKTGEKKAFFTDASVSQVKFRPNKGTITFLSRKQQDASNAIYEMSLSGGEATKVYSYKNNIATYDWKSDGQSIAFISVESGDKPKTSLSYKPTFFEEEYQQRNAYVATVSNSNATAYKLNVPGEAYMVSWSPDGTKIAVSAAPTASVDDSYMKQSVKIVSVASRNVIAEVHNKGKLTQISWSPDSKQLAILGAYDLHDPTGGSISIVSVNGGTPKVINGNYKGKYEYIDWSSPNAIYFLSSESVATTIGTIRPDGTNQQYILNTDKHQIYSFSMAETGAFSFIASSPTHPMELYTMSNRNANPARRTVTNSHLAGLNLGKQEIVSYKTRDGKYSIDGLLIYPTDYQKGKRYPLITVVHGGPESHYSNGWLTGYSMPGQMAAAKGYVVFYPNYRGSTGRGIDFTYSSQSDPAGKEFDDIVDGVDYLIDQGIVDEKRVGVTGGSYGGYASAWMSTYYSHRFAAAVMFVGISNNISKFGTSDIPNEMHLVHERGYIWEDWQKHLEVSPIYYVDRAQTPILIMHGAEDPRVHPAQSMELYRHIKVRKPEVPVRLIYYPGEGHGNARSGSKYDYNLRMLQWFDTYLMTGDAKAALPSLDLPE